jgi:hypothetical protein
MAKLEQQEECAVLPDPRTGLQRLLLRRYCARWTLYMSGILIVLLSSAIAISTHNGNLTSSRGQPPRCLLPGIHPLVPQLVAMSIAATTFHAEKFGERECIGSSAWLPKQFDLTFLPNFRDEELLQSTAPILIPSFLVLS